MSVSSEQYPAERLRRDGREIRLLTLLPGSGEEMIACTLRTASLENAESYEALSYEWGDSRPLRTILLNGRKFEIGDNLFQALRYLRPPSGNAARVLWIDALCINQSDFQERNHQVQQMADIYRQAHVVIAWIGLETEESREAFGFLQDPFVFGLRGRESESGADRKWQAVHKLCQRPYWRRVWIVQEICLAQRLIVKCGEGQIPWKYISELRTSRKHIWPHYLSRGEAAFLESTPVRLDRQRRTHQEEGGHGLWLLLEAFQDSLCKEIHDKVYGFLGLANDCGERGFPVDYSKSVFELYEDVIRLYHDRFQRKTAPHSPQLINLSEFLCRLLGPGLVAKHALPLSSHLPDPMVRITATSVMVIHRFLAGDGFVSPGVGEIHPIRNSRAALLCHVAIGRKATGTGRMVGTKMMFVAEPLTQLGGNVKGVAPEGTQLGDIVCTFVGSRVALIFRPTSATRRYPMDGPGYEVLEGQGSTLVGTLVGRAIFDSDFAQRQYNRSLNPDKTVEIDLTPPIEWRKDHAAWQDVLWPVTVSIDTTTLWLATRFEARFDANRLSKLGLFRSMISLLPREDLPPASDTEEAADTGTGGSGQANAQRPDEVLQKLPHKPQPRELALGPGRTGIANLGATGYLSATLQILYMLKPIRKAILRDESVRKSGTIGVALHNLFLHLQSSWLPASPLMLTQAMGWEEWQRHEARNMLEFFKEFTDLIYMKKLGEILHHTFLSLLAGKVETRLRHHGRSMIEQFLDIDASLRTTTATEINTLEDSLRDYCSEYEGIKTNFRHIPPVFLIHVKELVYNRDKGEMETIRTQFTYPRVLNLASVMNQSAENLPSDLVYQLHG
ncbi:heterokaryon incompatibility protein-domain-containing protein [Parachaetomium inaequale]|uniref:Heterokaryon incompatibility protein-domain-containing protein n=1 Tax=Parachaetomium inaequale TaxID=2588326 RepID=A0AAN6SLU9_9PEZI|nr:heterokaryon incompatibility protein-domain-containing protein [Parachaetomium inaequale]